MVQSFYSGFLFFLGVYASGIFHTLFYLRTNIRQQSTSMKIVSVFNWSVLYQKITEKVDDSFCRWNFAACLLENIFWLGQRDNLPRIPPAEFQSCVIFIAGVFFQRKVVWQWWADAFCPRSISLAAVLRITCCCHQFLWHGASAAQSASLHGKMKAACHTRLGTGAACARLRFRRLCRREIRVSDVKSPCDVTFHDLFLRDSSLLSAKHLMEKNPVSFETKSNFNALFFHKWKGLRSKYQLL